MSTYVTYASGLVMVGAIVGVGMLKVAGLLDDDTANTAVSLLIGLVGGGAIATYGRRV